MKAGRERKRRMKDREHGGGSSSPELSGSPNTLLSTLPPPPKKHIPHPLSRGFVGLWLLFVGFCGWDMAPGHPGQQLFHLTGHNLGSPPAQPHLRGRRGAPAPPAAGLRGSFFFKKGEKKPNLRARGNVNGEHQPPALDPPSPQCLLS